MKNYFYIIFIILMPFSAKSQNLIPFLDLSNNTWGYKDVRNRVVIKPKFMSAHPFAGNYNGYNVTFVKYKSKWLLINLDGKVQKKFNFDTVAYFKNVWLYKKDNKYGLVDKNGKVLTDNIYDGIWRCSSGFFLYKQNGIFGISCIGDFDNGKKEITDCYGAGVNFKYEDVLCDDITKIYNPNENLLEKWGTNAQEFDFNNVGLVVKTKGKYGLINTSGSMGRSFRLDIINTFDSILAFTKYNGEKYFRVKKDNKWGVYSYNWGRGKVVCPIEFDFIEEKDQIDFHLVIKNGKKGLLNNFYNLIVATDFEQILGVRKNGEDTFYIVQKDNKWGSIDISHSDYLWQNEKDFPYSISPKFLTINELEEEFIRKKEKIIAEKEKLRLEILKQQEEKIRIENEAKLHAQKLRIQENERLMEQERLAEIERNKKSELIESNNRTIKRNLINEDCSVIVLEYEKFATDYIKYCNRVKTKPYTTNIYEYSDWEKELRKMQDLVTKCADNENRNRILASMKKVYAATESISASKGNLSNNSNVNSAPRKCTYCKPSNSKGWYIYDYNYSRKENTNGRYIKKVGHKPCSTCYGRGTYKDNDFHETIKTCYICHGDRFVKCDKCKGEGYEN
jgi:hypothetical protein